MSLINEALKKAQRMRAEAPPSSPSTGPAGSPAPVVIRRGRPIPAQVIVLSILGGAVLIGATLVITLVALRPDDPAPPAPAVTKSAPAPETTAAPVVISLPTVGPTLPTTAATPPPASAVTPPPAAALTTSPSTPVVAAPAPVTAPPATAPAANQPPPATATPAESVASAPTAAPSGPAKPDLRVQEFIDRIRVSGIRASATDPRVSMNDRVFKLNDVVDRTLGLRIVGIESGGLTFVDSAGVVYTKNF
jgi:hypothetical protein